MRTCDVRVGQEVVIGEVRIAVLEVADGCVCVRVTQGDSSREVWLRPAKTDFGLARRRRPVL